MLIACLSRLSTATAWRLASMSMCAAHSADLLVRGGTSIPVGSLAGFEVVVLNGPALLRIPV